MTQSKNDPSNSNKERASALGPKASVTVEAALTIPLFLFAILSLVYLLEIQSIRTCIRSALQSAVKQAAAEAVIIPVVNPIQVQSDVVRFAGSKRLDNSIVQGGSGGISCIRTYLSPLTGEIHASADYAVRLPFPRFTNLKARFREEMKVKSWTGYQGSQGATNEDQIVYITDTALVYHEDYRCTYLQLSISFVPYSNLSEIRNEHAGKYHRCEKCVQGNAFAGVYITTTGGKYHNSLRCSGLKRTVHAIKKTDAGPRGGCSRCSK